MAESSTQDFADLVSVLEPEHQSQDSFIGSNPQKQGRLFGGLVAAQALVAAGRTVDGMPPHSLHAYFLRPGRPLIPLRLLVRRLKEGRNFHARHVQVLQQDECIFSMQASFTNPEEGISHQHPMPEVAQALETEAWPDGNRNRLYGQAFELRGADCPAAADGSSGPRRFIWIRLRGRAPEDVLIQAALRAYLSDRMLMSTGALRHRKTHQRRGGASLDHSVWFHQHVPLEGWNLYSMDSPVAHSARALMHGAVFDSKGSRLISVAQEGLLRMVPVETEPPE